ASVSVGLAGPGKLGDEPVLPSPDALALDVAAARAAGVDDLALFSLEGVLGRASPEAWLEAFVATPPRAPEGLGSGVARGLVRGMVWASRPVAAVGRVVVRSRVRGDLVSKGG
ncbi:hypothetical protein L6R52_31020, partial [Myxococcota bacterium]|nr:hypothetical protein [Myxococcota bacterium]